MRPPVNKIFPVAPGFAATQRPVPGSFWHPAKNRGVRDGHAPIGRVGRFNGASLLYRLLDAGIVIACGLAATELKFAEDMTGDPPPIHLFLIYLCGLGVIAVFPAFRLYQSWRGRRLADLAARCVAAWATVFALGILISFLMHQAAALSRMWAGAWFALAAVALVGARVGAYAVLCGGAIAA